LKKVIAIAVMMRPLNGLIAVLTLMPAVALGSGHLYLPVRIAIATFFIASYGYIINDLFDFRADKVNKPNRPFPARKLSAWDGINVALLCLVLSAVALAGSEAVIWLFFGLFAGGLFLYSYRVSALLVLANLWVATLCSSAFLLGGLITHASPARQEMLIAAGALTFLYHSGREIIKDIEDMAGDRFAGRRTIPIVWGAGVARCCAAAAFGLVVATSYFSYFACGLSTTYLVLISLAVNLPIVLIFAGLVFREREGSIKRASIGLKLVMIPALAALTIAGVG
jgi:geranylgeranylglycerol-phosphate geranylgeranyltransferase